MTWTQTILLSLIQGLTEFLPVSSSAHLILIPKLVGWTDQGLAFDVTVHLGTLIAILIYFKHDIRLLLTRTQSLLLYLILATIPVGVCGLILHQWIEQNLRFTHVIACSTIGFGLALGLSDYLSQKKRPLNALQWLDAVWMGLAQALSLIPGASRSGITLTAGLFRGFNRESAARFSFLMAISVVVLAGGLELRHFIKHPTPIDWQCLGAGFLMAAISGYVCIHYFFKLIEKIGVWPFVIYRCLLGFLLLAF